MYSEKPKLHQRQKAHKKGTLRTIALDTTFSCNFHCPHCYASPFVNKVESIELDILKKALDDFYDLGVFHYVLQGGEPVMDFGRLKDILTMIHPDETYINIVSNGWLIKPEVVSELKKFKVDKISFSLDDGFEAEHDKGRKIGSYQKVLEAIDTVLSEGLLAGLSTVVTHTSLYSEGFNKLYEIAKQKQVRLHIQIAEPVGEWDSVTDILMTPEDSIYLKDLVMNSPKLPNGQATLHRDIYSDDGDRCPAGTEFMSLTADGEFFACNFIQFSLGNIRDKSVKEMREALLTSSWFDGSHPVCLPGEDKEFIDKFIIPNKNIAKPLDANTFFDLKK